MKSLEFFFDFSSPFAYLAATQIEDLAKRNGARLVYRPFLLGGLFKAIGMAGVPLFAMSEPKRRLFQLDLARWADYHDVPLNFPSLFPMNTVKPLRMVLSLPPEQQSALVNPVFRAYWAEGRDISNDAVLTEIATAAGFDGAALVAKTSDEAIKERLKTVTEAAVSAGLCGAPSFLVGDLLFWGQDRLAFVERALQGWRPRGE